MAIPQTEFPLPSLPATEQYRSACESAALFDLSTRDQIELTGADRTVFLHNFCTQEIKGLSAGSGGEAFVTNIKGRILGHVLVFVGEECLWIDSSPGTAEGLIAHLDRYLITEDVQVTDRTPEWGEVALVGPGAASLVEGLLPGSGDFSPFQHGHQGGVTVRRFDMTPQPCWVLGTAREQLGQLAQRLVDAGAVPGSSKVFNALRIEAGFPVYGVDLTEENLAHEAGRTARAISFTKGCYLGQEPIARLESMGHTNRELRRLRLVSPDITSSGAIITDPDSGDDVGRVTSAALSPVANVGVALAMLRRDACAVGTELNVAFDNGPVTAVVESANGS